MRFVASVRYLEKRFLFQALTVLTLLIVWQGCDLLKTKRGDVNNRILVISYGQIIYSLDPYTFQVEDTIILDVTDGMGWDRFTLSANKEFLVTSILSHTPPFPFALGAFDFNGHLINMYETEYDSVGAPRLAPVFDEQKKGLVYFYTHTHGLFLIDVLSSDPPQLLDAEHRGNIGKYMKYSDDHQLFGILTRYAGSNSSSKITIYSTSDQLLANPLIVLNGNNDDGVYIGDFEFSGNGEQVYITYRTEEYEDISQLVGSYSVSEGILTPFEEKLPWSRVPYYIATSPSRNELYTVGGTNIFFILDGTDGTIIDEIEIDEKTSTFDEITQTYISYASRILVRDDENVAFVSLARDNFVIVIDMDKREIDHRIITENPYLIVQQY